LPSNFAAIVSTFNVVLIDLRIKPYRNVGIFRCILEPVASTLVRVFFELAADYTDPAAFRDFPVLANAKSAAALDARGCCLALTAENS